MTMLWTQLITLHVPLTFGARRDISLRFPTLTVIWTWMNMNTRTILNDYTSNGDYLEVCGTGCGLILLSNTDTAWFS